MSLDDGHPVVVTTFFFLLFYKPYVQYKAVKILIKGQFPDF